MKFLVIKDLDATGEITQSWLAAMQNAAAKSPEALRKDYAKLVESIARLHIIESALRKEVLHVDEEATPLTQVSEDWLPGFGSQISSLSKNGASLLYMALQNAISIALGGLAKKI